MRLSPVRAFIIVLCVGVLLSTVGVLYLTRGSDPASLNELSTTIGTPDIGGAFTLTDQNGKTVRDTEFAGRQRLVFFGFTHCPDICPAALGNISQALDLLGAEAAKVVPVFITVDPERDTPARLKEYMQSFHPSFIALTGTPEQIRDVADAYKVYFARQHGEDPENYVVGHSGFIYLLDGNGKYLAHFRDSDSPKALADAIRSYLP